MKAARPRTVLLSLSGVLLGGFLAASTGFFYPVTMSLAALTAMLLQILSNLANDYGDFKKGTDNINRTGPKRVMQGGELTEHQMQKGIVLVGIFTLLSGSVLLLSAWSHISWKELAVFVALGIAAVLAALFYTLGKHPYGYRGLGDLFCFLFFGWAAVAGTNYLSTLWFDFSVFLPATAMGFLSNAVLNINNMRDYENDKASGKNSIVVKLGLKKAFVYHCMLIVGAFVCLTVYIVLKHAAVYAYMFLWLFLLFFKDLKAIKTTKPELLDPFLGQQVRNTFLLVIVFGILQCL